MHVFDERVRLMRHWADQLRQRQVQLLVVAVPDKSRIEADRLCGLPASQPMRRVLDDWQRALQAQGVPFVDLRPALSGAAEPMFFRTDVHMNAQGAQAAARRVADAALPLLGGVGQQAFRVDAPGAPAPRMGDLIVLAGLEHARMGWRPELERVARSRSNRCAAAACWTKRRLSKCCWPAAPTAAAATSPNGWAWDWAAKSGT